MDKKQDRQKGQNRIGRIKKQDKEDGKDRKR
jgi:hypothetical protein